MMPSRQDAFAVLAILLLYSGLWLILTPYESLNHDGQVYAAQALTITQPEPLAGDIFLRYRSQDEFTIFPLAYAFVSERLGLEPAASTLTFAFHLLWYFASFLLLRRLLDWRLALLGVGLLVTVPGVYGGMRIFHLAEPFLTARLPAEVLCLFGLWLGVARRWVAAIVMLALAFAVHPLIAFPAALLIGLFFIAGRWGTITLPILVAAGIAAAVAGSYILGGDTPYMDGRWLAVSVMRSRFLFIDQWNLWDWNHTLQTLVTLLLGWHTLRTRVSGNLLLAAMWLSLAGLALSALYSLVQPLEVLIQGQPWRWHWPARFLAIGTLPAIVWALWQDNGLRRAAALLLVAGWIFVPPLATSVFSVTLMGAGLAIAAFLVVLADRNVSLQTQRLVVRGGWAVLFAVGGAVLVTSSLAWYLPDALQSTDSGLRAGIESVLKLIGPSVALAMLGGTVALCAATPVRIAAVAGAGLFLLALSGPDAANAWTKPRWSGPKAEAFLDWRRAIPVDAEVLWFERVREVWFLLGRRSYLSRSQSGGVVFSAELAEEIARRALVLEPIIDPNFWLGVQARADVSPEPLTKERLSAICRDPELGFVVWDTDLGLGAPAKHWPTADQTIYLYDCSSVRSGAANADG